MDRPYVSHPEPKSPPALTKMSGTKDNSKATRPHPYHKNLSKRALPILACPALLSQLAEDGTVGTARPYRFSHSGFRRSAKALGPSM